MIIRKLARFVLLTLLKTLSRLLYRGVPSAVQAPLRHQDGMAEMYFSCLESGSMNQRESSSLSTWLSLSADNRLDYECVNDVWNKIAALRECEVGKVVHDVCAYYDEMECIRRAILELDDESSLILALNRFLGKDFQQIADELKISETRVQNKITLALYKVRKAVVEQRQIKPT